MISCYPNEFDTRNEAQIDAARVALKEIKNEEYENNIYYSLCEDTSDELAQKLFDCIGVNGFFLFFIPPFFR